MTSIEANTEANPEANTEANKDVVREFIEGLFSRGDLGTVDAQGTRSLT